MNGLVQHGDITHEISINWRTDSPGLIGQIHPPRQILWNKIRINRSLDCEIGVNFFVEGLIQDTLECPPYVVFAIDVRSTDNRYQSQGKASTGKGVEHGATNMIFGQRDAKTVY